MNALKAYIEKQLSNPEFAEEYEKLRPEYEAVRAKIGKGQQSDAESDEKGRGVQGDK